MPYGFRERVWTYRVRFFIIPCLLLSMAGCSRSSNSKNLNPLSIVTEAASKGDAAQVTSILASHPDLVSRHMTHGYTLLHMSTFMWTDDVTTAIIRAGADVDALDSDGITPLIIAIHAKKVSTVQLLLKNGASPNLTRPGEPSPLYSAVMRRNYGMVKLLVDHGADVNFVCNGTSILRAATLDDHSPKIAAYLKMQGAKLRADERY